MVADSANITPLNLIALNCIGFEDSLWVGVVFGILVFRLTHPPLHVMASMLFLFFFSACRRELPLRAAQRLPSRPLHRRGQVRG